MAQRPRLRERRRELLFFRLAAPRLLARDRPLDRLLLLERELLERARPLRPRDDDRDADDRADLARDAEDRPPFVADFLAEPLRDLAAAFLRPDPLFRPPPETLFSVAQALRAASPRETPRCSYPSSMCRACRFCFAV